MWNWLFASDAARQPIKIALQPPDVNGNGKVFAFTANYRLELRGRTGGIYFNGGSGLDLPHREPLEAYSGRYTHPPCNPIYLWWGYNCSGGAVITNLTEVHSNAGALGFNGGIGCTVRTEAPYSAYVESRYYFAPTSSVSTKLLTVTVGIRY